MFKIGDKVVCMNPSMNGYHDSKLYHTYCVDFVGPDEYFYGYDVNQKSPNRISTLLNNNDFITFSEYRKRKIDKICSNIRTW
jgi:hypothetical protein